MTKNRGNSQAESFACRVTVFGIFRLLVLMFVLWSTHDFASGQTWTQLSPSGTPPSPRGFHGASAVYDPSSNRMIVFGGRESNQNNTNDVWLLTNANGLGGTPAWINLLPANSPGAPASRSGHSAVYDIATNRMMVFGGCEGGCLPALNDV